MSIAIFTFNYCRKKSLHLIVLTSTSSPLTYQSLFFPKKLNDSTFEIPHYKILFPIFFAHFIRILPFSFSLSPKFFLLYTIFFLSLKKRDILHTYIYIYIYIYIYT